MAGQLMRCPEAGAAFFAPGEEAAMFPFIGE